MNILVTESNAKWCWKLNEEHIKSAKLLYESRINIFSLLRLSPEASAWCTVLVGFAWPCSAWEAMPVNVPQAASPGPLAERLFQCAVWLVWWLLVRWQSPQESGCWQWHFHSAWSISVSLSPCSLEPAWQGLTPDIWEPFPPGDYSPKQARKSKPGWDASAEAGSGLGQRCPESPPKTACAGLLPLEARSRGCLAGGTSAVFIEWSLYYLNFIKGVMPGLWLNQVEELCF